MATKEKNFWVLLVFILCGIVIGGLIGELAKNVSWLNWLGYGQSFGLSTPVVLNLGVLTLTFAFMITINVASIFGIAIAIFIYRKI